MLGPSRRCKSLVSRPLPHSTNPNPLYFIHGLEPQPTLALGLHALGGPETDQQSWTGACVGAGWCSEGDDGGAGGAEGGGDLRE